MEIESNIFQKNERIGDILVNCGLITPQQLEDALEYQKNRNLRLGEALTQLGHLTEDQLTWALGVQLDLSYIDLQPEMINWDYLLQFPLDMLCKYKLVPISRVGNTTTAVICDPGIENLIKCITELIPYDNVTIQLASEEAILNILNEVNQLLQGSSSSHQISTSDTQKIHRTKDVIHLMYSEHINKLIFFQKNPDEDPFCLTDSLHSHEQYFQMDKHSRNQLLEYVASHFRIQFSLPDGLYAIQSVGQIPNRPALRFVSLMGINGWMAAIDKITDQEMEIPSFQNYLVCSPAPIQCKSLLKNSLAPHFLNDPNPFPLVTFESYIDSIAPGWYQSELAQFEKRFPVARHFDKCIAPQITLMEIDGYGDLANFSGIPPNSSQGQVIVLLRRPVQPGEEIETPRFLKPARLLPTSQSITDFIGRLFDERGGK